MNTLKVGHLLPPTGNLCNFQNSRRNHFTIMRLPEPDSFSRAFWEIISNDNRNVICSPGVVSTWDMAIGKFFIPAFQLNSYTIREAFLSPYQGITTRYAVLCAAKARSVDDHPLKTTSHHQKLSATPAWSPEIPPKPTSKSRGNSRINCVRNPKGLDVLDFSAPRQRTRITGLFQSDHMSMLLAKLTPKSWFVVLLGWGMPPHCFSHKKILNRDLGAASIKTGNLSST